MSCSFSNQVLAQLDLWMNPGKEDDVVSVGQGEPVNLGLDVGLLDGILLQPLDADLAVEVTNVAHDGVVLHPDQEQTRTMLKPFCMLL